MYKINLIKIAGFRRLLDINLLIRPYMVLIGANGVGKTSLLEAFALLSASAAGNLSGALSQAAGITSLLTRGKTEELSFLVDMEVPGYQPLEFNRQGRTLRLGEKRPRIALAAVRLQLNALFRRHCEERSDEATSEKKTDNSTVMSNS